MKLKERYTDDLKHINHRAGSLAFWGMVFALVLFPLFSSGFMLYNLTLFFIYALVSVSLMVLVGFTGQVSLGHAGFLAAGAYVTTFCFQNDVPYLLALLIAFVICGVLGALIGLPALRLEGPYLGIATLGFGLAIQQILSKWRAVGASSGTLADRPEMPRAIEDWVGGRLDWLEQQGLLLEKWQRFRFDFYSDAVFYYFVFIICLLCILMLFNLRRSHVGRAFIASRDAELAAQMSGVNLAFYKTLAFVLSAAFTGLAGGLFGSLLGYITPESFNLLLSIKFLLVIVLGGLGFLPGAIIGAAFITGLDGFLSAQQNRSQLIFGLVVIGLILFEPRGIYGRWQQIRRYWRSWPM